MVYVPHPDLVRSQSEKRSVKEKLSLRKSCKKQECCGSPSWLRSVSFWRKKHVKKNCQEVVSKMLWRWDGFRFRSWHSLESIWKEKFQSSQIIKNGSCMKMVKKVTSRYKMKSGWTEERRCTGLPEERNQEGLLLGEESGRSSAREKMTKALKLEMCMRWQKRTRLTPRPSSANSTTRRALL